jgi:hypothetical protein
MKFGKMIKDYKTFNKTLNKILKKFNILLSILY